MKASVLCIAALTASFASPALVLAQATSQQEGTESAALALLEEARQVRRQAVGTTGEEKLVILRKSVAAYQKVVNDHGDHGAVCAEATFRIGEIQRSLKETGLASDAFSECVDFGRKDSPRFAARALNELAHMERRDRADEKAVLGYQKVVAEFPGEEKEGVKALTWIGKIEQRRGNTSKACETWLSIADRFPSQPMAALRAMDLAALTLLDAGESDRAREVLDSAQRHFSEESVQQEYWSPELQDALENMKIVQRLAEEREG